LLVFYNIWVNNIQDDKERALKKLTINSLMMLLETAEVPDIEAIAGKPFPVHLRRRVLKKKYTTKKGARQALELALRKPFVRDFQNAILNTLLDKQFALKESEKLTKVSSPKNETCLLDFGPPTKKISRDNRLIYSSIKCCSLSCNKTEAFSGRLFDRCPCRTVTYCSKKCQLAHWPGHKKVCAWKKNQKSSSSSSSMNTRNVSQK
jgi:hypothetical protein